MTTTEAPTVFVPAQPEPVALVAPVEMPVEPPVVRLPVDHVRAHGTRCYWDLRACRWECRPD